MMIAPAATRADIRRNPSAWSGRTTELDRRRQRIGGAGPVELCLIVGTAVTLICEALRSRRSGHAQWRPARERATRHPDACVESGAACSPAAADRNMIGPATWSSGEGM